MQGLLSQQLTDIGQGTAMPGSALVGCPSLPYAVGSICVMSFAVVFSIIKGSVVILDGSETSSFPCSRRSINRWFPKAQCPMVLLEGIENFLY